MTSTRLGDLVSLRRGASYKSALLGDAGIPLLGLGTIQKHGGFKRDKLRLYGGDAPARMRIHGGDLYVSLKDMTQECALLGAVARVPLDIAEARLTQDTIALDLKPRAAVDPAYLYWQLRTARYRNYCRSHGTGTTNVDLSQESFLGYTFDLPSLATQREVVAVLGALDNKIAANRRVVSASEELAIARLRGLDHAAAPLAQIAEIVMGTSPKGEDLNTESRGLPFFQGVRDFGRLYPAERVFTEHAVRETAKGSVLFAVRAPVGEVNLAVAATAIGRGVAGLTSRAAPATLFFAMRAFKSIWDEHQGGGTVFASVNRAQVNSAELPWPKDADQVERELSPLLSRSVAAEQESERLGATRDELLPLLMDGRITVRDAEKRVEGEV